MRLSPFLGPDQRGQAGVEAALVIPLCLFLILGILQLILLQQARLMTDYAAYRTARGGALAHARCNEMVNSALAALLPTQAAVRDAPTSAERVGIVTEAWRRISATRRNRHLGVDVPIVRIRYRTAGGPTFVVSGFDQPLLPGEAPRELSVELVHLHELQIPFANSIFLRTWLAQYWAQALASASNPLLVLEGEIPPPPAASEGLDGQILSFIQRGLLASRYFLPIKSTFTLVMMSDGGGSDQCL